MLAVALVGSVVVAVAPTHAAPGSLDPSFGSNGTVTTAFGDSSGATALASQPDGKIVALGRAENGFALVRYLPSGTLDPGFGVDGRIATVFDQYDTPIPGGLALQSDGKIVVVGYVVGGPPGFVVERFNADGTPDMRFGLVRTPFGDGGGASAVAVPPDGRIVVGGAGGEGFALARYNSDGSLDESFGSDGKTTAPGGFATSLALQPNGMIVVAGIGSEGFTLVRFNPDGSLDSSFGDAGHASIRMGYSDELDCLALQPDGKIVVAGWTSNLAAWVSAIARFNPDGSLDAGFGAGGKVIGVIPSEFTHAVAIQSDGKIVVAGGSSDPLSGFEVARLQPDGSPDLSFGAGGRIVTTFRQGRALRWAEAFGVVVQPDGKIVAAGSSVDGFALARYLVTPGCVAPDVSGAWVPEAKESIHLNGCSTGSIRRVYSRHVGRGFVLSQTPAAGASLPPGAAVDLTVSKGRKPR